MDNHLNIIVPQPYQKQNDKCLDFNLKMHQCKAVQSKD
jgi:hypothetical protein